MTLPEGGGSNGVLAWILGGIGIGGALWAAGAKIFSFVTRTELVRQTAAQDAKFLKAQEDMEKRVEKALEQHRLERIRIAEEQKGDVQSMHGENREVNAAIFKQLGEQDRAIARIEGRIDGALRGRQQVLGPIDG